jgi:hypothetical protein
MFGSFNYSPFLCGMENGQNQSVVKYVNVLKRNGVDTDTLEFNWKGYTLIINNKNNPSLQLWSSKADDQVVGMDGETIVLGVMDLSKDMKDAYVEGAEFYSVDKNYLKKSVELVKKHLVG